jgi:hypothetical protein
MQKELMKNWVKGIDQRPREVQIMQGAFDGTPMCVTRRMWIPENSLDNKRHIWASDPEVLKTTNNTTIICIIIEDRSSPSITVILSVVEI